MSLALIPLALRFSKRVWHDWSRFVYVTDSFLDLMSLLLIHLLLYNFSYKTFFE